jgi:uncharacterized damage-inducible protein DinB
MNWTQLLKGDLEMAYHATEGLIKLVDKDKLDWKPATGSNWMTTGQLLHHITEACGMCCKGFVTGDWGIPEGAEMKMPTAEELPTIKSVAAAQKALAADKKVALAMIAKVGEKALGTKRVDAPWDPTQHPIGRQFLHMISHLQQHKSQLFYYLKLQGKPVHTGNLWGM